jgi:hypothetical protein
LRKVTEILLVFLLYLPGILFSQAKGEKFLNLTAENINGLEIIYSMNNFSTEKVNIEGVEYIKPLTPGCFLPGIAGNPDLAAFSSFISVPKISEVKYEFTVEDSFIVRNINIPPAPVINRTDKINKLEYHFNKDIYSKNITYPDRVISVTEKFEIRGINLVVLSYTPYKYNPVNKELTVFKKVRVKVIITNPSGGYSNLKLRSKWFDPLITKYILNKKSIEKKDFSLSSTGEGFEYIIITPNNNLYYSIADTIRRFRNKQGIKTGIFKLSEIGGNNFLSIKNFIKNAYLKWEIPPVAVLLMADEGNNAENQIFTPYYNNQFITDFRYADMNDDNLPDLIISRIPVENSLQLYDIIRNTIKNEEYPSLNPAFYNKPITALGWETTNWFQICIEVAGGFLRNVLNKNTIRVNDIYSGNPLTDPWSTAPNTQTVLNYFGPQGLNYIPATPQQLGGFTGGTPEILINAINSGSFFLIHRDHGNYTGWGKPGFNTNHIDLLNNQFPVTVLSINCQTGQFNWTGGRCFSEKFLQHTTGNNSGTISIISASDLSYPFLNDVFTWGIMDYFWDNFLSEFNSEFNQGFMFPAFANVSGKYFLAQSSWVQNQLNKIETYYLFHHFGDCFASMCSEVPGNINISHQNYIYEGERNLRVLTDSGALIGVSADGDYLNSALSNGGFADIYIPGEHKVGDSLEISVTKRNAIRTSSKIPVIINPGVSLNAYDFSIYDEPPYGNGNGKIDYTEINDLCFKLKNIGLKSALNIKAVLSSDDAFIHISDSVYNINILNGRDSINCSQVFRFLVYANIPDSHSVKFKLTLNTGKQTWVINFSFTGYAPVLEIGRIIKTDSIYNNNGLIEPGDTVIIKLPVLNKGSSKARLISGKMNSNSTQYINILTDSIFYGEINPIDSLAGKFKLSVNSNTPLGTLVKIYFRIFSPITGIILYDTLKIIIGGSGTIYLGNGTKTTIYPYSLYFMDGKTEMLFTAQELDSSGAFKGFITKIGFNVVRTNYIPLNNFTIKLRNTTDSTISNFTNSGWTICFTETVYLTSSGWNIYILETPFYWNGVSNILITVCYDNYSYSYNSYVRATPRPGRTAAAYFDLSSGSGCDILNGNSYTDRPDISIEFGEIIGTKYNFQELPAEFRLFNNFPNPFNSSTKIKYQIPENTFVEVTVYDILGRMINILEQGNKSAGTYWISWDADNLPSGLYICRMKTDKYTSSIKLLLVK